MTINELIKALSKCADEYGDDHVYLYIDGDISGYVEALKFQHDGDPDPEARYHRITSEPLKTPRR